MLDHPLDHVVLMQVERRVDELGDLLFDDDARDYISEVEHRVEHVAGDVGELSEDVQTLRDELVRLREQVARMTDQINELQRMVLEHRHRYS